MHREHKVQKEELKVDLRLKVVVQYENLKSLIYWGAANEQENMQLFSKHLQKSDSESMFASTFIADKSREGLYTFDLTSLKPYNIKNAPNLFEKKGLEFLEKNRDRDYYDQFTSDKYTFIGKLEVKQSCLQCHAKQGYKINDIRGGISISPNLESYYKKLNHLNEEIDREVKTAILILVVSIITIAYFMLIARKKNIAIHSKNIKILELNKELETQVELRTQYLYDTINQTVQTLINLVESRDTYTAGHSQRVHAYAMMIGKSMNLNEKQLNRLDKASYLHDIGKIDTPAAVLLKPGKLDNLEYELIQNHAQSGYEALSKIEAYKNIANIVKLHHERYDGSGYPNHIKDGDIPIEARIIAVADTFDAMTTSRIYKSRMQISDAIKEIEQLSGKDFDPVVVEHAIKVLKLVHQPDATQLPTNFSEHHRMAYFYKDGLTNVYNKEYLYILIEFGLNGVNFECFNVVSLNNFHAYNKSNGWDKGNQVLIEFAKYLQNKYSESFIFRVFGDDFVVLNYKHIEITNNDFKDNAVIINKGIKVSVKHFDLRKKYDKQEIEDMLNSAYE